MIVYLFVEQDWMGAAAGVGPTRAASWIGIEGASVTSIMGGRTVFRSCRAIAPQFLDEISASYGTRSWLFG